VVGTSEAKPTGIRQAIRRHAHSRISGNGGTSHRAPIVTRGTIAGSVH
jgi:hypothetical protein